MKFQIILILILITISFCRADDNIYVLNDVCTKSLYISSENYFSQYPAIETIRDVRGIVIRFELKHPAEEYYKISDETLDKIRKIKYFLAKIKNPIIIEVHTNSVPEQINLKNWEFSTIIAENIEDIFTKEAPQLPVERIYTVGYGEFMPDTINSSNKDNNYSNRVDIIILCSVDGE